VCVCVGVVEGRILASDVLTLSMGGLASEVDGRCVASGGDRLFAGLSIVNKWGSKKMLRMQAKVLERAFWSSA
jgi:hypothetical protein